jgi:hypothetical protein
MFERTLPPSHPELAAPLRGIAMCERHAGRPREAIAAYERALALVAGDEADPLDRARTQMGLAETLASVDPARARELVAAIRGFAREAGGVDGAELAKRCDALALPG